MPCPISNTEQVSNRLVPAARGHRFNSFCGLSCARSCDDLRSNKVGQSNRQKRRTSDQATACLGRPAGRSRQLFLAHGLPREKERFSASLSTDGRVGRCARRSLKGDSRPRRSVALPS